MAIAVCATIKIKPLSKSKIEFSLVWNMPVVKFGDSLVSYKRFVAINTFINNLILKYFKKFFRFYTRYFSNEDVNSTKNIACYSVSKKNEWLESIKDWQRPIIENQYLLDIKKSYIYYFINLIFFKKIACLV